MPPKEKYNAVLEGLLSGGGANPAQAIELIAEMNGRRIKMSSQALKALIDSGAIHSVQVKAVVPPVQVVG